MAVKKKLLKRVGTRIHFGSLSIRLLLSRALAHSLSINGTLWIFSSHVFFGTLPQRGSLAWFGSLNHAGLILGFWNASQR